MAMFFEWLFFILLFVWQIIAAEYSKKISLEESFDQSKTLNVQPLNLEAIRKNTFNVTGLVNKSITLSCSIHVDEVNFFNTENYKVSNLQSEKQQSRFFSLLKISLFICSYISFNRIGHLVEGVRQWQRLRATLLGRFTAYI
jgi:hypothetical protein